MTDLTTGSKAEPMICQPCAGCQQENVLSATRTPQKCVIDNPSCRAYKSPTIVYVSNILRKRND
jgi:hypothetical protein